MLDPMISTELDGFVKQLDEFQATAWSKRCDLTKDATRMAECIEWRQLSETKRIGLGYIKKADGKWYATMSVTNDTPDNWKVVLLQIAEYLSGEGLFPEMGTFCAKFRWEHKEQEQVLN